MSLSLADVDLQALSERAKKTLSELAQPLAGGTSLEDLCERFSLTRKDAQHMLDQLAAEMKNLTGGARLPKLSPAEYEALRDSIDEHGQLYPILVDGAGNVVDGHNRLRACKELGIVPDLKTIAGRLTADQLQSLALVVNVARRHLPASARRGIALAELLRDPTRSDRSISVTVGMSPSTIGELRRELERTAQLSRMDSRVGLDDVERKLPERAPRAPRQRPLVTCPECGHSFDPMEG